jgi:hypothetical protein
VGPEREAFLVHRLSATHRFPLPEPTGDGSYFAFGDLTSPRPLDLGFLDTDRNRGNSERRQTNQEQTKRGSDFGNGTFWWASIHRWPHGLVVIRPGLVSPHARLS